MIRLTMFAALAACISPSVAGAQAMDHGTVPMPMPTPTPTPTPTPMPMPMPMPATRTRAPMAGMGDAGGAQGSGTSLLPIDGGAMPMIGVAAGGWMLMAHGYAWASYTDQGGARGDRGAFVQSMAMLTAAHDLGGATIELRSMLSLDPLMGRRGYPDLLATGETAFGRPLIDRQHPHDLFMELAARIDVPLGGDLRGFVYGGPVGEPALGPAAFMHRPSARYLPLAPISHHWFDSTHISYGVVTGGVRATRWQVEASAFRGREPDEARWNIEAPRLDSWSVRASWSPSPHWTAQVSHGRLAAPESQHRGEDEARSTASVQYGRGGLTATLAWSVKDRLPGPALTAWLGEANWAIGRRHTLFGRWESVANDELFAPGDPRHDVALRVARAEGGYAYRLPLGRAGELALGGSVLAIATPPAVRAAHGAPIGYTLFARLSLGQ